MSWSIITFEDLSTYLMQEQLHAISACWQEPARPKFVQKILEDITAWIRAEVATAYPDQLDTDPGTVPNELKAAAAQLAIEALVTRLPGLSLSPDQVRGAKAARHLLQRVAGGNFSIKLFPKQASAATHPSTIQRVVRHASKLTRAMLEGL